MGDSFSITPEQLRGSGSQIADLGGGVAGRGGEVTGDTSIWGADEPGAAFGAAFSEAAAEASAVLAALSETLGTVGHNLGVMADNVDAVDQDSAGRFDGLAGQV